LQPPLEKILGQPVIVINKPGAGATIGFGEVMTSAPDGYTLGIISPAFFTVKHTIPKAGIDYIKFEPIVYVGDAPNILAVRKEAPWNTLKEFLDYTKANPGKVSVGNGGYGGTTHIFAIAIEHAAGIKFIHVTYKGTAPSFIDLLGGHVHAVAAGLTDTFSLIKGDKIKPLAVTPDRSKFIPNVQSFKELGMNVDFPAMYAFLGPKGIPKERVNILYNAFKKSTEAKEFMDYFQTNGAAISVKGPEEFAKFLKEKDKSITELIVIGGIKPQ
jgi:tripartite-type tricarboxylate transporter receptor subunit TctC